MKQRKAKMPKMRGKKFSVEAGKLPDNKKTGGGFVRSEAQRFVKAGSTGSSSKDMDAYANKRNAKIARDRKQGAR